MLPAVWTLSFTFCFTKESATFLIQLSMLWTEGFTGCKISLEFMIYSVESYRTQCDVYFVNYFLNQCQEGW